LRFVYIILTLIFIYISYGKEISVDVVKVKKTTTSVYYKTDGKVVADKSVKVKPLISGRIINIYIKEGQKVKKGDILAKIETDSYNFQYNSQLYTVKKLEEIYNYNKSIFEKKQFLYKKGLISEEEFLLAKRNFETSKDDLKSAKERLKELEKNLKETDIKAPFDGIVDKKYISEGDYITPATNLFYILDPKSFKFVFYLPQRFIKTVKLGKIVYINIENIGNFKGKIEYISYSLTNENMIKIKASLKETPYLREGLYGTVKVKEKEVKGFIVPERTVFLKGKETYVLKVENNKTKKVDIKIIGQKKGYFIVKGNIKDNDLIILNAPFGIKENLPVKVEEVL